MRVIVDALRTVMTVLSTQMVEDVTVYPDGDGWMLSAISPDRVTAVEVRMGLRTFDDYVAGAPFAMSVSDTLASLPKGAEWVTMTFTDARVTFEADGLRFKRALMPPEETRPRIPSLTNLGAEASTDAWRLLSVMSEGDRKYGTVRFTVGAGGLTADCTDEQGLGVMMELTADQCDTLGGEGVATYPLSAWVPFLRALPRDTMVTLVMGTDKPLVAYVSLYGTDVTWLVAPYLVEG